MKRLQDFKFDDETAARHYEAALQVAKILKSHNYDAYFIGGAVRDMLLGHMPKDFDVVTNAKPEQILELEGLARAFYKDTAQAFGVTRVKVKVASAEEPIEIEVATYRSDIEAHLGRRLTKVEFSTLNDDLNRRDLTINALAYDPDSHELVDMVGGLEDLENKLVNFIGDPLQRIHEDPLRIMRAVRLKNQLSFNYTEETRQALEQAVKQEKIEDIATDRVRGELTKMLINNHRQQALKDLDRLGIIKKLIPELYKSHGVDQPEKFHKEGDVWTHTVLAMGYLPTKPSKRLVWGTLLHDIGKPYTISEPETEEDRIRFNSHAQVGADKAEAILRRLSFPNKLRADIVWMVHYHMTIGDLPNMSRSRQHHYMQHRAFGDLLELHKADAYAAWQNEKAEAKKEQSLAEIESIWQQYQQESQERPQSIAENLGIDGNWVMNEFNLEEGELVGQVVTALQEAYLDGDVKSVEEAREYGERHLKKLR